ncbi:transcriptional regulator [Longispora fulva]|nr:transcriptional regulator [Longispora fulva]
MPKPNIRLRRLGAELKKFREDAGFTQDQAAEKLDITRLTLSRFENGHSRLTRAGLRDLMNTYEVMDETTRSKVEQMLRDSKKTGWLEQHAALLSSTHALYCDIEAEATVIQEFSGVVVPGLLQTEAYALAVYETGYPHGNEEMTRRFVDIRLARQDSVLGKEGPPEYLAVIDESVLRRVVGSHALMADQLRHLLALVDRPRVLLQVVRFEAGFLTTVGALTVFGEQDRYVYASGVAGGSISDEEADYSEFRILHAHLQALALSPRASVELIREVADEHDRLSKG